MKFQFNSQLDYQTDAVKDVINLFDGFKQDMDDFSLASSIVPNVPDEYTINWDDVFENYLSIARENDIIKDRVPSQLEFETSLPLEFTGNQSVEYPSFTVEMETGTGKTYVYLKTIFALHKEFNFTKFIIVVPSRAIYEGVLKTFVDARSHFLSHFGNPNVVLRPLEITNASAFAEDKNLSIILTTLDSFNRASNKVFKAKENGSELLPYQMIQATRPILILDEPQNMESELSQKALATLNPLFSLRYSATHRRSPNQVYRLSPYDAYSQNLVKKIQVFGFKQYENLAFSELQLISISKDGKSAKLKGYKDNKGLLEFTDSITVKQNMEIFERTENPHHKGISIDNIDSGNGRVELSNGDVLTLDHAVETSKRDLFRAQLEETIKFHIKKQDELIDRGIKVLSLIFIDRVANYKNSDGIIRTLFEELFEKNKSLSKHLKKYKAHEVHDGYFASTKNAKTNEEIFYDEFTKEDQKEAQNRAYALIMKDKEKLLSFDDGSDKGSKVCFIFAHSALREGWDNPNVFQICTLNTTVNEIKKRQEIGRGLRLPVNQTGERLNGFDENVLTVIANESYESYVSGLQREYEEAGVVDQIKIRNAEKPKAKRNDTVFTHAEFRMFWDKLLQRVHYKIDMDSITFIDDAASYFNNDPKFPPKPKIYRQEGRFGINKITITLLAVKEDVRKSAHISVRVDDTTQIPMKTKTTEHHIRAGIPFSSESELKFPAFRGLIIKEIIMDGKDSYIIFTDDRRLDFMKSLVYQIAEHTKSDDYAITVSNFPIPVPNFLEQIGMELGITRKTIFSIFKRIHPSKKEHILTNPEGFLSAFYKGLNIKYADHIAENVTFYLHDNFKVSEPPRPAYGSEQNQDPLEVYFPAEQPYVESELIKSEERFIYDQVQIDSDIEEKFITHQVSRDPNVVLYFKFPSKFRLQFPSIIGNYNPDWGIIRKNDDGTRTLHLVRETKGSENISSLRFEHEKRKIRCAIKYFNTIDVDYRAISDKTDDWWNKESSITLF